MFTYRLLYEDLMITTKTLQYIHTQKKASKYNSKISYQITKENKREREEKPPTKQIQHNKMAKDHTLIITLYANGINISTKKHRLAAWIQKQGSYICCLQETHFRSLDT